MGEVQGEEERKLAKSLEHRAFLGLTVRFAAFLGSGEALNCLPKLIDDGQRLEEHQHSILDPPLHGYR